MKKFSGFAANRTLFAVLAAMLIAGPAGEASAQGLFEFFNGTPRQATPAPALAYADPVAAPRTPAAHATATHASAGSGRTVAYCVRLCDGRHFPIQQHSAASAVQLCNSFCPATPTKVFSGSDISRAVARDGSRYTALENAFAYRARIVTDCTCNGKDSFGVAAVDISADPTLRNGDIVANGGPVAYAASNSKR